jgi:phage tail-like protein
VRAAVPGLISRHPLGQTLPSLYAADDFAQRFTAGLDVVLAPILCTLDNLPSYLDAWLAPEDFVNWLAGWVAAEIPSRLAEGHGREAVARAAEIHRWRGTRHGLAENLRLRFGVEPEIEDSGATTWSTTPGAEPPGSPEAFVLVRIPAVEPAIRIDDVLTAVAACVPAHVRYRVETAPDTERGE